MNNEASLLSLVDREKRNHVKGKDRQDNSRRRHNRLTLKRLREEAQDDWQDE
jgi:hypothetical protein